MRVAEVSVVKEGHQTVNPAGADVVIEGDPGGRCGFLITQVVGRADQIMPAE